ncbi:MAG: uracil-DNA glycosylase [Aromatoleum sp.]|nr:uracil-DNA glycosylase [Aromatoleum sp.]
MRASAKKIRILTDFGTAAAYDADCRRCARLAAFLDHVKNSHPAYFCRPVPPFGAADAPLVVVGLAPGMHGANASGRPFTGDHAGILLYETLFAYGFASQPTGAHKDDGLVLAGCRITNAVKCLPPQNKPMPSEIAACGGFLAADLAALPPGGAMLALGRIAHDAVLRAFGRRPPAFPFGHGAVHAFDDGIALFDSYHCSRYNTNTRRLTRAMFRSVFDAIAGHLGRAPVGERA